MKSIKRVGLAILFGLVAILAICAYLIYNVSKEDALRSCLLSLESPILELYEDAETTRDSKEWVALDQSITKKALSDSLSQGKTDCPNLVFTERGEDHWGNELIIEVRAIDGNRPVAKIVSAGPDKVVSTPDDIEVEFRRRTTLQ